MSIDNNNEVKSNGEETNLESLEGVAGLFVHWENHKEKLGLSHLAEPKIPSVVSELKARLLKAVTVFQKQGYIVLLIDGARSREYQEKIYTEEIEKLRKEGQILTEAKGSAEAYVLPPEKSKHVKGEACDIALCKVGEDGKYTLVDMGNNLTHDESAALEYPKLTEEQMANRMMWKNVLDEAGLAINPKEWWHVEMKE